jgi:hypothetical protein
VKRFKIAGDEGCLLGARPALQLSLRSDCVRYPIELLVKGECDWATARRVAAESAYSFDYASLRSG